MAVEIERKFLVRDESWRHAADGGTRYRQGYLSSGGRCSVRVRSSGERAWLSLKSARSGMQRLEFEYPIPMADAECILGELTDGPLIEKVRYRVGVGNHVFEIDCFEGANAGLIVAEVELGDVDEAFPRPPWLGPEVTAEARYYNASLVGHPYRDWTEDEREPQ
jgi:adenylate cyclase